MRRLALVLFGMLLLGLVTQGAQAQHRHVVDLHGTIAQVLDHAIVLATRRGEVRIEVTRETIIIRNGRRARLQDLRRGDMAGVRARMEHRHGGHHRRLVALEIRARGHM